jgi:hypothetical protein
VVPSILARSPCSLSLASACCKVANLPDTVSTVFEKSTAVDTSAFGFGHRDGGAEGIGPRLEALMMRPLRQSGRALVAVTVFFMRSGGRGSTSGGGAVQTPCRCRLSLLNGLMKRGMVLFVRSPRRVKRV